MTRYASMADLRREMHPRGHGCAMPLDRRAAGANRTRCAMRPDCGRHGHPDTAGGGLARRSEGSRGTTGQRRRPASKPRLSWRLRQSRWPGRHPGPYTVTRHRSRDAIGAEQEAAGPCRVRHAAVAARDGKATASRGFTQQCGSESFSSKDGGSPSKTNLVRRPGPLTRRRARSIPRAAHRPPMHWPPSRSTAVRGRSLTGLINTPSLTRPAGDPSVHAEGGRSPGVHRGLRGHTPRGRPCARSSLPADSHRTEVGRRGACGARPELRLQALAGGARRRLARHAHGALIRAGASRGHPARARLQGAASDRAPAQARGGAGARVEAPGTVHRHDEEPHGAHPLVGEAGRPPGCGALERRARYREPRVRDQRGSGAPSSIRRSWRG